MPKKLFYRIAYLSWLVFITFSSLFSFTGSVRAPRVNIPHADKLVHFLFYFVVVCLGMLAVREHYGKKFNLRKALLCVVVFAVLYGIGIELLQYTFTATRHGDLLDVLANTLGALVGMFVVKRLVFKDWSLK